MVEAGRAAALCFAALLAASCIGWGAGDLLFAGPAGLLPGILAVCAAAAVLCVVLDRVNCD